MAFWAVVVRLGAALALVLALAAGAGLRVAVLADAGFVAGLLSTAVSAGVSSLVLSIESLSAASRMLYQENIFFTSEACTRSAS